MLIVERVLFKIVLDVCDQSQLAIFGKKQTRTTKITKHIESVTGWYFATSSVMFLPVMAEKSLGREFTLQ